MMLIIELRHYCHYAFFIIYYITSLLLRRAPYILYDIITPYDIFFFSLRHYDIIIAVY